MINKNIPKLRFKGFHDEWEKDLYGNKIVSLATKHYITSNLDVDGEFAVIQQGDNPTLGFSNDIPFKNYENVILFGDHTLSLFNPSIPFLLATDGLKILQANEFEKNFLFYITQKYIPESQGYKRHFSILKSTYIYFSNNTLEQSAIGTLFQTLDELLSAYKDNLANYQAFKATMLSKMFPKAGQTTPEIRLDGFDGEWEEKTLGKMADIIDGDRGKNYPTEADFATIGHTLFLSANNITKVGLEFINCQFISQEKSNNMGKGQVLLDDIVLTSRGSIGHLAYFSQEVFDLFSSIRINSGMLIIRRKNDLNSKYLITSLNSPSGNKQLNKLSFGSAQPQLTKRGVESINIFVPNLDEQYAIGTFFANIDDLIASQQAKIAELETLKKKLLQDMFL
ncbi:restriction endonuclease subunit S [Streptococcus pluranimalium]|uniref:restriction endonuclease subunit S n=1 Tax=Streptococcus pluranimalium TaxID=82348 RepID=UPI002AAC89A3|nr:restriction endonuclease subunit S [Streptococcus suis]